MTEHDHDHERDVALGRVQGAMEARDRAVDHRLCAMDRRLERIEASVSELAAIANKGKGALWISLKLGSLALLALGALGWLADRWTTFKKLLG